MSKFNIVFKHRRGCLHSVILECPYDDLSSHEQEAWVESIFLKSNPKSMVIAVLPLSCDELSEG